MIFQCKSICFNASVSSVMALPNISCGKSLRYKGTFSPQLHAFGYEGRAGMHGPLYLSFAELHHVGHQSGIVVNSLHPLLDRNLYQPQAHYF